MGFIMISYHPRGWLSSFMFRVIMLWGMFVNAFIGN